jgi:NAD(P)-dependent dehydrogenase (short-subunit alcohol dehydrogenase family)
MTRNDGKVAIVTGASRGIGAPVAERLASEGFTVIVNYSGDAAAAEAQARKIEAKGGRALTAKADVSDPHAVRGMFDAAEAAFGGVDVLVNSAGIMTLSSLARESSDIQHLESPCRCSSMAGRLMPASTSGLDQPWDKLRSPHASGPSLLGGPFFGAQCRSWQSARRRRRRRRR